MLCHPSTCPAAQWKASAPRVCNLAVIAPVLHMISRPQQMACSTACVILTAATSTCQSRELNVYQGTWLSWPTSTAGPHRVLDGQLVPSLCRLRAGAIIGTLATRPGPRQPPKRSRGRTRPGGGGGGGGRLPPQGAHHGLDEDAVRGPAGRQGGQEEQGEGAHGGGGREGASGWWPVAGGGGGRGAAPGCRRLKPRAPPQPGCTCGTCIIVSLEFKSHPWSTCLLPCLLFASVGQALGRIIASLP